MPTDPQTNAAQTSTPLTRDGLLALIQNQPRTRTVDIPEYGVTATVRELRSAEATEYAKRSEQSIAKGNAYLLTTAVVGPDGSPLFAAGDTGQVEQLPALAVDHLTRAIGELSFRQLAVPAK